MQCGKIQFFTGKPLLCKKKRRKKMRGFVYRLGIKIREAGENAGRKFYAGALIRLGIMIRNIAARTGR
jgi:hypothetical protein